MYRLTSFPDRVKIGPYWYRFSVEDVVLNDPDEEEGEGNRRLYGQAHHSDQVIRLQAAYECVGQAIDTVIHELLHAIHWCYRIKDGEAEEETVQRVAMGLTAMLADNPDLERWLSRAVKRARNQ